MADHPSQGVLKSRFRRVLRNSPSRQIRFQEITALIEQGDAVFFGHCIGKAIAEIELGGVALAFAEAGEGIDSLVDEMV